MNTSLDANNPCVTTTQVNEHSFTIADSFRVTRARLNWLLVPALWSLHYTPGKDLKGFNIIAVIHCVGIPKAPHDKMLLNVTTLYLFHLRSMDVDTAM